MLLRISRRAENFTLQGDLVITSEPDSRGDLGEANEIQYNQITVTWQDTDYSILLRSGSIIEATTSLPLSAFIQRRTTQSTLCHSLPLTSSSTTVMCSYGSSKVWSSRHC